MGAIGLGTGLIPIISGAVSAIETLENVYTNTQNLVSESEEEDNTIKQQQLALTQLKQQQALEERQAAQEAELEKQSMAQEAAADAADREKALKRAVARQKAVFGARGVGSGTGSSEAVLLGLFDESDEEAQAREKLDTLRLKALDQNLDSQKSMNLLQASQLAAQQKLERAIMF